MSEPDPHESDEPYYECVDCRHRVVGDEFEGECPECGGEMENISKPKE